MVTPIAASRTRAATALLVCAAWVAVCGCGESERATGAAGDVVAQTYLSTMNHWASGADDGADAAVRARRRPAAASAGHSPAPEPDEAEGPGAETGPGPDGYVDPLTRSRAREPIALERCVRLALAHNLGLQIARYEPARTALQVVEAEAVFDPAWFLNNALGRIRRDTGTLLAGAPVLVAKQWEFATGIETLLETGGTISLAQDWTYQDSNSGFVMPNPQYDTDLGLTLRHPLLRGAGVAVTRSGITLARLDHAISLAELKRQVMDVLLEVERTYWDLAVAQQEVASFHEALVAARENRRIADRRVASGKDKRVVLSLAESAVRSREAALIEARLRVVRVSDELKRLMNSPDHPLDRPSVLQATEVPLAEPLPVSRALLSRSLVTALANRPELEQAEARVRQSGVVERVARNERLPQLDLAASYILNGLDADVDRAVDEEVETNFFDWTVGLELSVPIGNRARRAAHERSRLEQAQAIKAREDVRQQVLLEVSRAVRDLAGAEESVLATRAAREAAQQVVQDQQANVSAGAALLKDLLDSQRDLAVAKVAEIAARAAYLDALAELERATGTLLEYNEVQFVEDADLPRADLADD